MPSIGVVVSLVPFPVRETRTECERRSKAAAKPLTKTIIVIENGHTYVCCSAAACPLAHRLCSILDTSAVGFFAIIFAFVFAFSLFILAFHISFLPFIFAFHFWLFTVHLLSNYPTASEYRERSIPA